MNSPSERLQHLLFSQGLCTPRDLKACERHVRRLVRDLPVFDSVWIDALVQNRRLTPWQGRILQSSQPDALQIGPCIRIDQLGESEHSTTFLARHRANNAPCVLRIFHLPGNRMPDVVDRLDRLVQVGEAVRHLSIVIPQACLQRGERVILVSRHVTGSSLRELLIRRGRFVPSLVAAIGKQLLDGLIVLDRNGLLHGDIGLSRVRLSHEGIAVLVDTGIGRSIRPSVSIHDLHRPEDCTGIAPELIDTRREASASSDLYALGCVLWQLLCGRPPFPVADPLARLAANAAQDIADVRDWSPDTPDWLADAIRAMTSRQPELRPHSFADAAQSWPRAYGRTGNVRVPMNARTELRSMTRNPSPDARSSRSWPMLAAVVMLLAVAGLFVSGQAEKNPLLAWGTAATITSPTDASSMTVSGATTTPAGSTATPDSSTAAVSVSSPDTREAQNPTRAVVQTVGREAGASGAESRTALRPLPEPDPDGRIELRSNGPWVMDHLAFPGHLQIIGVSDVQPVIVARRSTRVTAGNLTFRNLRFRQSGDSTTDADAGAGLQSDETDSMLSIVSQNLTIDHCEFMASPRRTERETSMPSAAALAWQPDDALDPSAGRLSFVNSFVAGFRSLLVCRQPPVRVDCENVLALHSGPFVRFDTVAASNRRVGWHLRSCTLRGGSSLLEIRFGGEQLPIAGNVDVVADDCVFDLHAAQRSIFAFAGVPADLPRLRMTLSGSPKGELNLVRPGTEDTLTIDPNGRRTASVVPVTMESLIATEFGFAGRMTGNPRDSVVVQWQAPRQSTKPPGIDAVRLTLADATRGQ